MQVRIGKEARVSCSVTGTPSPAISWKKVDGHMPPHVIEGDQLVIPRVSSVDSGEYICIASNRAGSAEDQIKLRITGKILVCQMHSISKLSRITIKMNDN